MSFPEHEPDRPLDLPTPAPPASPAQETSLARQCWSACLLPWTLGSKQEKQWGEQGPWGAGGPDVLTLSDSAAETFDLSLPHGCSH